MEYQKYDGENEKTGGLARVHAEKCYSTVEKNNYSVYFFCFEQHFPPMKNFFIFYSIKMYSS